MLLVLLVVAFWTVALMLVVALCTAARRGEQVLGRNDLAVETGAAAPPSAPPSALPEPEHGKPAIRIAA